MITLPTQQGRDPAVQSDVGTVVRVHDSRVAIASVDKIGEVGRQAHALGAEATPAINAALLAGAKVIKEEASVRIPRYAKHRTDHGRSPKHLADVLVAAIVTKRKTAGVTVEGNASNGPSYYWKFVEHGTVKMKARKYIAKSAEAREGEVIDTVATTLKKRLRF